MKENSKRKENLHEIAVYLLFGVLTTVVSMATYFGILWAGEYLFMLSPEAAEFNVVRVVAEIMQWVLAVLFAFFTNRKWVFKNAGLDTPISKQLLRFSASRLATLGLDALITFGTVWILQALDYHDVSLAFIGLDSVLISADLIAKLLASVVVVVTNYVLSKLFVFKAKEAT